MDTNQPLLSLLSDDLVEALLSRGVTMAYDRGQTIHQRGDTNRSLSIILSGRVRFGLYQRDGEYIQTAVLGWGHCFGEATLFADTPRAYHADAIDRTELLDLKKRVVEDLLAKEPALAGPLLVTLTSRLYESLEFADDLRSNSLEVRIAKQLLRLHMTGNFGGSTIQVRQSDLAFGPDQSRVSIGKALGRLKSAGLIELGYGEIGIRAMAARVDWTKEHDLAR